MNYQLLLNLPEELRGRNQWAVSGTKKIPSFLGVDGKIHPCDVNNPNTFMDFNTAIHAAQQHNLNVGYILHHQDPFTCIDMDFKDSSSSNASGMAVAPELWTQDFEVERYTSIINSVNSYTEVSKSGVGIHIWVKANIGGGRRRDGVEIYSQQRYIICTGNVISEPTWKFEHNLWSLATGVNATYPLAERQDIVNHMVEQMGEIHARDNELTEVGEEYSDEKIMAMATKAGNSEKFINLWNGSWQHYGYPSQSEADLSLMSMLTFYSKSNEQCRRLFRQSVLGQREKSQKDNRYLNYTLGLIRKRMERDALAQQQFDNMAVDLVKNMEARKELEEANKQVEQAEELIEDEPEINMDGLLNALAAMTTMGEEFKEKACALPSIDIAALQAEQQSQNQIVHVPQETNTLITNEREVPPDPAWFVKQPEVTDGGLPWPPGLTGQIASFIYHSAPRPVREIAIASALGVMSGICGKAWNIPNSGLNMYIILICESAMGKEALHQGPAKLAALLRDEEGTIDSMIDPSNHVSGAALRKHVLEHPSTCNFQSEFGRKLKRMADERDNTMGEYRTTMTELYQKSAHDSRVGGVSHSNKDNNVAGTNGVAYSMVGESTPATFYESLTESMMEDGFLSRFNIIEYNGLRPPHNHKQTTRPKPELLDCMRNMMSQARDCIVGGYIIQLGVTKEFTELSNKFSQEMDDLINDVAGGGKGEKNQAIRQMYNRAHLKFLRLSALLAIGNQYGRGHKPTCRYTVGSANPSDNTAQIGEDTKPVMTLAEAGWAMDFIRRDINLMKSKIKRGEVGLGEMQRDLILRDIIREFLSGNFINDITQLEENMYTKGIILYSYLSRATRNKNSYRKAIPSSAHALRMDLQTLCDCSVLQEVDKLTMTREYGTSGKGYRILQKP